MAATNVDFTEAIANGRFREDLYYRLNTVPIKCRHCVNGRMIFLFLFRKFAADFAEKYRMPAIQLMEDAKLLLVSYTWPGNIRQLKNITEQISIIETNREITAEILRGYLPVQPVSKFPTLLGGVKPQGEKSFQSEREILYQVLFDLRRDVTELKKLVHDIMAETCGWWNGHCSVVYAGTLYPRNSIQPDTAFCSGIESCGGSGQGIQRDSGNECVTSKSECEGYTCRCVGRCAGYGRIH